MCFISPIKLNFHLTDILNRFTLSFVHSLIYVVLYNIDSLLFMFDIHILSLHLCFISPIELYLHLMNIEPLCIHILIYVVITLTRSDLCLIFIF